MSISGLPSVVSIHFRFEIGLPLSISRFRNLSSFELMLVLRDLNRFDYWIGLKSEI